MSSRMDLMDLARHLRQESLFVQSEKQNLQSLNEKNVRGVQNMRLQSEREQLTATNGVAATSRKDNRHDVVRSVRKGTWFSESKLAITIILRLTRYWFDKSMNEFVMNDLKVNKNMTKLIRHMWRRSYDHKLVNENFHKFLASIARVYQPTDHDEMQA
ncbi:hypothetical protein TNCV_3838541 [Trichonephila clavipes]|nr:hypothetical protein TNCV_3838541 [Trichonephila clavipes]